MIRAAAIHHDRNNFIHAMAVKMQFVDNNNCRLNYECETNDHLYLPRIEKIYNDIQKFNNDKKRRVQECIMHVVH